VNEVITRMGDIITGQLQRTGRAMTTARIAEAICSTPLRVFIVTRHDARFEITIPQSRVVSAVMVKLKRENANEIPDASF